MTVVLAEENKATVPRLVKFSGVLTDFMGRPLSGEVEVTFALYKQEADEEPLWKETQKLEVDKQGGYTVLIGATQPAGVPAELFRSDEARWLSVQVQGEPQSSRILLVSVPYALKAVEAEKLGGKSVSDFVLSESLGEQVRQVLQTQGQAAAQPALAGTTPGKQSATTSTANTQASSSPQPPSPGPMLPPSTFSGTTSDQIVLVQQKGSGSGLVGTTASTTGNSGVVGLATSTSTSNYQNGVYGQNAGAGAGVAGIATNPSAGVGVYGQSANFAGVFGNSVATSGFSNGVYGQTSATSGFVNGVYGHTSSTGGNGVLGIADGTSGEANGVFGQSSSPFGVGVFGNSANGQTAGVYGQTGNGVGVGGAATASSGGPAFGVWGGSVSTSGTGVAGYEDATSGFANGVLGESVSPDGNGVIARNRASNGGNGIRGIADGASGFANGAVGESSSPDGNGVIGQNRASNGGNGMRGVADGTSGFANGVVGESSSPGGNGVFGVNNATAGGAGVVGLSSSPSGDAIFGTAASSSGYPHAVVGFLDSQQGGVAGQFVAHGGAGLILQGLSGSNFNQVFSVDANGNLNISGNLVVSGSKSAGVKLQNGREVALYAVESPENWFEDFGSGEMNNGVAWVPLEGSFAEATNATVTYHVFLTANGDSNGLYVSRKTPTGFEVREHGGAASNVAFDYRIVVRRRGYESIRMAEVHRDIKTTELSREHLAGLASTGNLKKIGAVKVPLIAPAPSIRPVQPRPNVPALPKLNVPQGPRPR